MIDLKIYTPDRISTKMLREDLHTILTSNDGRFISGEASLSLYGYSVQQSWLYLVRDKNLNPAGKVILLTNDFNHFEEPAPYVPGGKICYSAKITFIDFSFSSNEFARLKQAFDHLNAVYHLKTHFLSSLDELLQKYFTQH